MEDFIKALQDLKIAIQNSQELVDEALNKLNQLK